MHLVAVMQWKGEGLTVNKGYLRQNDVLFPLSAEEWAFNRGESLPWYITYDLTLCVLAVFIGSSTQR